jgi:predicted O-linked N-acetylglucosamine transferase (SPINDLY family)
MRRRLPRAVQLGPNIPEAWNNLGSALKDQNQPLEGQKAFERAIQLRPNYAVAHNNLGNTLSQLEHSPEAEAEFRIAITLDPNYAEAYSNLALLIGKLGRLDESVALCRRALAIKPDFVAAYMNLGTGAAPAGESWTKATTRTGRGAAIDPNHIRLHENLLGAFTQTTRWSPQEQLRASVEWGEKFAKPQAAKILPHQNDRNPDRKLRVGYASPDFRRHSVAYFFEPILGHHDREQFEITLYANNETPDEVTERFKNRADRWRDVTSLKEEELAGQIRDDRIDILVDLAGHTAGNRLAAFGYKPAPVQMTYLGWPATTGVGAVDYRLTDEISDPPGMTDAHYNEKLIRLPAPFLCYRPPGETRRTSSTRRSAQWLTSRSLVQPRAQGGAGDDPTLGEGAASGAESRNCCSDRAASATKARAGRIFDGFAACGVAEQRIQLVEAIASLRQHLESYGQVDIALDTYPYHGTTTTCEALWMGVPVISRIGQTHVSRVGLSLLSAVGLQRLTATTAGGLHHARARTGAMTPRPCENFAPSAGRT